MSLLWRPEPRPGCVRGLPYDYASDHRVPAHVHDWHQLIYAGRWSDGRGSRVGP
jgi:hypothetical protein